MKIRALTFVFGAFFFNKIISLYQYGLFFPFSAVVVVRGTLLGVIPAPVRGIKAFFGAKRHLFARPRAYTRVRALNYVLLNVLNITF